MAGAGACVRPLFCVPVARPLSVVPQRSLIYVTSATNVPCAQTPISGDPTWKTALPEFWRFSRQMNYR